MRKLTNSLLLVALLLCAAYGFAQAMRSPAPPASINSYRGSHLGPPPASIYSLRPVPPPGVKTYRVPGQFHRRPDGPHHGGFGPYGYPGYMGYGGYYGYGYGYAPLYVDSTYPGYYNLENAGTFDSSEPVEPAPATQAVPTVIEHRIIIDHQQAEEPASAYSAREAAPARAAASPAASPAAPVVEEPATTLVFRDGHRMQVTNYAIIGDKLLVLSGKRTKFPISDLNLKETARVNDENGVEFRVPASAKSLQP